MLICCCGRHVSLKVVPVIAVVEQLEGEVQGLSLMVFLRVASEAGPAHRRTEESEIPYCAEMTRANISGEEKTCSDDLKFTLSRLQCFPGHHIADIATDNDWSLLP